MFISSPQFTLRYSYVMIGAVLFGVVLMVFVGWALTTSPNGFDRTVMAIVGFVSLALLVLAWALYRQRIAVHPEGLVKTGVLRAAEIRWEEVGSLYYDEVPMSHALLAHFGLLGAILMPFTGKHRNKPSQQSLRVETSDGRKISIGSNYRNCKRAIDAVMAAINPRLLADYRKRLAQGDSITFGKITLGPLGIGWKNRQPLPYSNIEKAYIGGRNFRAKATGKWLDAISVPMRQVPNLHVLLDVVQEKKVGGMGASQSIGTHV